MDTTDDLHNVEPTRISRRTALRGWVTSVAPLLLLTACGGGSTATAPTVAPVGTLATPAASPTVAAAISTASPSPQAAAAPAASPAASPVTSASPSASPAASPLASPVAAASPAASFGCILTPEQTEGPYYIDANLLRADITEGREGRPLQLNLMIQRLPSCQPVANALVEIWQCDALGEYSGFTASQIQGQGEPPGSASGTPDARPKPSGPPPGSPPPGGGPGGPGGGPPGGERQQPANTLRFLSGGQMTDANGRGSFQTIYPGWYMGRTVHIHFKIRTDPASATGYSLTSQMYFDDALTDQVHATAPYSQKGARDTRNSNDGIYRDGGAQLTLPITPSGQGFAASFGIGLQMA
jgi:protocatechuate 3,4-dioxygenase beta subunit